MVNTHILVSGFGPNSGKMTISKKALFLKNCSPGLKADLHQKLKKSIKSTIHKCTINVIPVTNPDQYTKLDK